MWLLYKGRCNQIWVLLESYMKQKFTPLYDDKKPLDFVEIMFGNYLLERKLECYLARPTPTSLEKKLELLPHQTNANETFTLYFSDSSSNSSSTNMPNIHVQISFGPWFLTNQEHMMAQGLSVS